MSKLTTPREILSKLEIAYDPEMETLDRGKMLSIVEDYRDEVIEACAKIADTLVDEQNRYLITGDPNLLMDAADEIRKLKEE